MIAISLNVEAILFAVMDLVAAKLAGIVGFLSATLGQVLGLV